MLGLLAHDIGISDYDCWISAGTVLNNVHSVCGYLKVTLDVRLLNVKKLVYAGQQCNACTPHLRYREALIWADGWSEESQCPTPYDGLCRPGEERVWLVIVCLLPGPTLPTYCPALAMVGGRPWLAHRCRLYGLRRTAARTRRSTRQGR